jgi:hypothetical protein
MRRRLALVVPAVFALLGAPGAQASDNPPPPPPPVVMAPTPGVSALIAVPAVGHSGDLIYLSGTGLKPRTRYYVLTACPSALVNGSIAIQNGNVSFIKAENGPMTDGHGNFVRFTFRALPLHHVKQSGCTIYTSDGVSLYGPDVPGTYYIYPQKKKLPRCALTICAGISLSPTRARTGQYETITIGPNQQKGYTSWPGAKATVIVSFKGTKSVTQSVVLNWAGVGKVRVHVPDGMAASQAKVHVSYHIGNYSGSSIDQFAVVQ